MSDVKAFTGPPVAAVAAANAEIALRGNQQEPRPIEFVKVDEQTVAVVLRFRIKTSSVRIYVTDKKDEWTFSLSLNHPVISLNGVLWYFGVK